MTLEPRSSSTNTSQGARFGPRAIRAASSRQIPLRSFNQRAGINPYTAGLRVLDCGDIPVTAFDNALALRQMTEAYT
jgi:agmatinase